MTKTFGSGNNAITLSVYDDLSVTVFIGDSSFPLGPDNALLFARDLRNRVSIFNGPYSIVLYSNRVYIETLSASAVRNISEQEAREAAVWLHDMIKNGASDG